LVGLVAMGFTVLLWLAGPRAAAEFCRYRGAAALDARDEDLALAWLGRAERLQDDSGLTQFLLARTCRRLYRFDDMLRHLERAVACGFPRERSEREKWLSLTQIGRTDELGSRLQKLLDDPGEDSREILDALANGFSIAYDLDSANLVLSEWMTKYPDDPESYIRAALLKRSQGEWPAAVELYRRCLKLVPGRTSVRLSLAQSLARANDPAAAEPEYRRCLAEQPDNIEARAGLGACLVNLGRLDQAKSVLAETLRLDPRHFDAARSLGELELSEGHSDAALAILTPLAERWPHDKQLCTLMARAWQESGQSDRAQPYWEEADRATTALMQVDGLVDRITRDKGDIAARYELGLLLLECASREAGIGWLESVLKYEPRHRAALAALADFYDRSGDPKLAQLHRGVLAGLPENDREP
jgi:tetratricopeptide (TPR) repeat protein